MLNCIELYVLTELHRYLLYAKIFLGRPSSLYKIFICHTTKEIKLWKIKYTELFSTFCRFNNHLSVSKVQNFKSCFTTDFYNQKSAYSSEFSKAILRKSINSKGLRSERSSLVFCTFLPLP